VFLLWRDNEKIILNNIESKSALWAVVLLYIFVHVVVYMFRYQ